VEAGARILPGTMVDETLHSEIDESPTGASVPAGPQPPAPEPVSRRAPGGGGHASVAREERRRRRMRRTANAMIAAALLGLLAIVLYFVGTCAYTSHQQGLLRDQLAADNPELANAVGAVSESDFVSVDAQAGSSADLAALAAAEAERQAQLATLKTAADEYQEQIRGHVGRAIGRIAVPSIGLDVVMIEGSFEGFSEKYLRRGPGHWPETHLPGQGGSVVVSGHRSTYGAPFFKLNEVKPGDEVQLVMPYAIIRYTVTRVIIVLPEDVQTVADQGKEQVSLVACHPVYSAKQRIIVQADMSSFVLLEAGPR
jgi:LPXTG-site transpeptidase (sortase) family protein